MKADAGELAAALAPGALLALAGLGAGGLLAATLAPVEREALGAMLAPRAALLLLAWAVLAIALGVLGRRAHVVWVRQPARLAEAAQALLADGDAVRKQPLPAAAACASSARALVDVAERLARQRDALRADIGAKVREAARGIEQERSRLAALMSELTQSVIVCNLDGRILLYNPRARLQFRALSPTGGAELLGLGRSIYAVFDRQLVAHALESVQQRLQRGPGLALPEPARLHATAGQSGGRGQPGGANHRGERVLTPADRRPAQTGGQTLGQALRVEDRDRAASLPSLDGGGDVVRARRGSDHRAGCVQDRVDDDVQALAGAWRAQDQRRVLDRRPHLLAPGPAEQIADVAGNRLGQ